MKRFIVILAVFAALLSCNPNLTTEVSNNSSYTVTAVISGGKTLTLPQGRSDEIDRGDTIRSFTADLPRVSLRAAGDDYEFYNTPAIDLDIYNLAQSLTGANNVNLSTSGSTDKFTDPADPDTFTEEDPITFTGQSPPGEYKIYTTTPTLKATVTETASGKNYPLSVSYDYDPSTDTMFVTIR
jgi:hypothetical protein